MFACCSFPYSFSYFLPHSSFFCCSFLLQSLGCCCISLQSSQGLLHFHYLAVGSYDLLLSCSCLPANAVSVSFQGRHFCIVGSRSIGFCFLQSNLMLSVPRLLAVRHLFTLPSELPMGFGKRVTYLSLFCPHPFFFVRKITLQHLDGLLGGL